MTVDSMYQEIILDHYRNPQHKGLREPYDVEVHHVNPTCGDEVTLRLLLSDGSVEDISYDSIGCSISQASASVMSGLLRDRDIDEALGVQEEFLTLLQSRGEKSGVELDRLEDAVAFAGVSRYPARIKCALLPWMAWKDAALQASEQSSRRARHEREGEPHGGLCPRVPPTPKASATNESRSYDCCGGIMTTESTSEISIEDLTEAMRDVVDPELGINVVDLGLVYGLTVSPDKIATIDMTLTSAACPLTDVIEDQTRTALEGLVEDFRINWVWMPPWGPDKVTEDGREQLRALGFNI